MYATRFSPSGGRSGFGLIEIVLALSVILIALPTLPRLTVLTVRAANDEQRRVEAAYLAAEALEAVRTLRGQSWATNIASQPSGTARCLAISGGSWTITTTTPCTIAGTIYTRTVLFSDVYRNASHYIAGSGTLDAKTRLVTATATWPSRGTTKSVVLKTYLTNYLAN